LKPGEDGRLKLGDDQKTDERKKAWRSMSGILKNPNAIPA
jgi:hypothetical protein